MRGGTRAKPASSLRRILASERNGLPRKPRLARVGRTRDRLVVCTWLTFPARAARFRRRANPGIALAATLSRCALSGPAHEVVAGRAGVRLAGVGVVAHDLVWPLLGPNPVQGTDDGPAASCCQMRIQGWPESRVVRMGSRCELGVSNAL